MRLWVRLPFFMTKYLSTNRQSHFYNERMHPINIRAGPKPQDKEGKACPDLWEKQKQ
jgi:hypothetical protein